MKQRISRRKRIKRTLVICLLLGIFVACIAGFVFLSPLCYADSPYLTDDENFFIKDVVLEAVKDRLSILPDGDGDIYDPSASEIDIIQLDKTQEDRHHLFIFIDWTFMRTAHSTDDGYYVSVRTYGMEESSSDCEYEIRISKDYHITSFILDP